jgi:hypothetical protein
MNLQIFMHGTWNLHGCTDLNAWYMEPRKSEQAVFYLPSFYSSSTGAQSEKRDHIPFPPMAFNGYQVLVSSMRFRTLRHSSSVEILPLVTLSPTVSASPYDLRLSDVKLELAVPRVSPACS